VAPQALGGGQEQPRVQALLASSSLWSVVERPVSRQQAGPA